MSNFYVIAGWVLWTLKWLGLAGLATLIGWYLCE